MAPFFGHKEYWKYFAEILTRYLIIMIHNTDDELEFLHPFYEFKKDFHVHIERLLKFPFKCLSNFGKDSFIRPYFTQIILCLMKKIYTSIYCLDYLHLIKNLFKNIIFFHKYEELFQEFNELCCDDKVINIFNNFIGLYDTNIPELKEIVIELIILLPLKTRSLITKYEVLSTPLINSLSLFESSFILRGLKTLDVIIVSIS